MKNKRHSFTPPSTIHTHPESELGPIPPPPEIMEIISAISDDDRHWFEQNPGERVRVRPSVAVEFWPLYFPAVTETIVTQVAPGYRTRAPKGITFDWGTERVQ